MATTARFQGGSIGGGWSLEDLISMGVTEPSSLKQVAGPTPQSGIINIGPDGAVRQVGNVNTQMIGSNALEVPVNPRNTPMTTPNPAQGVMTTPKPDQLPALRTATQIPRAGVPATIEASVPTTVGGVRSPQLVDPTGGLLGTAYRAASKATGRYIPIIDSMLGAGNDNMTVGGVRSLLAENRAATRKAQGIAEPAAQEPLIIEEAGGGRRLNWNRLDPSLPEDQTIYGRGSEGLAPAVNTIPSHAVGGVVKLQTPAAPAPASPKDVVYGTDKGTGFINTPEGGMAVIGADGKTKLSGGIVNQLGALGGEGGSLSQFKMVDQRAEQLQRLGALGLLGKSGVVNDSTTALGDAKFAIKEQLGYVPTDFEDNPEKYVKLAAEKSMKENVAETSGRFGVLGQKAIAETNAAGRLAEKELDRQSRLEVQQEANKVKAAPQVKETEAEKELAKAKIAQATELATATGVSIEEALARIEAGQKVEAQGGMWDGKKKIWTGGTRPSSTFKSGKYTVQG